MDLGDWDWEFLDDSGLLDFHERPRLSHLPTSEFHMNYFTCTTPSPYSSPIPHAPPAQLHLDQTDNVTETPYDDAVDLALTESVDSEPKSYDIGAAELDQYSVSQVFFKKTRDNQLADMKLDSPEPDEEILNSPRLTMGMKKGTELELQRQKEVIWEEANGCHSGWKWSLNGIRVICSFGIAVATICILVLGSHHGHKNKHRQRTPKLHCDDKIKTKQPMSAVRGDVPNRARIRTGGRLHDH